MMSVPHTDRTGCPGVSRPAGMKRCAYTGTSCGARVPPGPDASCHERRRPALLVPATPVDGAIAGHAEFNDQLATDGLARIGFGAYLMSSDFAVDVMENWQSEYLQFFLYIVATVWLLLRGSPESKKLLRPLLTCNSAWPRRCISPIAMK
ncbi:DUF6766 family protein [Streptomyces sp. NPDC002215]|uniref:DUF6766 family protein n=1 Tax=Streptomyces sp. NPDC002215 TaxID=3154412 RepID=UPI00332E72D0